MRRTAALLIVAALLLPFAGVKAGPAADQIRLLEDRIAALEARVTALEEAWTPTSTPSATPSPAPSSTPSATPSATPVPSASATPSVAPTPSPAPTATPTTTPPPSPSTPAFGSRPNGLPVDLKGCRDVVIENLTMRDFGQGVIAIRLDGCTNVTIRAVDFLNVAEAVYAVNSTNITIVDSRYSNIIGPAQPRTGANVANFVQFNNVRGGLIARNKGKGGDTEDVVSLYKTSSVVVEDNHFEGTNWTSGSGSGIALGDDGGSGNIARRNVLVNIGQVGAFIAGGTNHQLTDNIIIGEARPKSNVGLYVWNQYPTKVCSGHTVARNRVLFLRSDGVPNPYWNAGNCSSVAGSGNVWNDTTLRAADYRVGL